jgi:Icc-related predicted phosphoesterase
MKKMKIQIVSDLHLEFGGIEIKNATGADVLVLSGDICVASDLYDHPHTETPPIVNLGKRQESAYMYRSFFKNVASEFEHVVYVAGNHEHYHGKWSKTIDILTDETSEFGIHFLERSSVKIKDVLFVGGTMWTDMNKSDPITLSLIRDSMNDYKVIRDEIKGYSKLAPITTYRRHVDTVKYIKNTIRDTDAEKVVVVTHHAPSYKSIHPVYVDDFIMNGAYASDLSELILDNPKIALWTHGHIHHANDYYIGSTRIVCNPRGYDGYELSDGFDLNKVVDI